MGGRKIRENNDFNHRDNDFTLFFVFPGFRKIQTFKTKLFEWKVLSVNLNVLENTRKVR